MSDQKDRTTQYYEDRVKEVAYESVRTGGKGDTPDPETLRRFALLYLVFFLLLFLVFFGALASGEEAIMFVGIGLCLLVFALGARRLNKN